MADEDEYTYEDEEYTDEEVEVSASEAEVPPSPVAAKKKDASPPKKEASPSKKEASPGKKEASPTRKKASLKDEEPPPATPKQKSPPPSTRQYAARDETDSPTPGKQYADYVPTVSKSAQRKAATYSGGKPSTKHDKAKLMRSEGIVRIQAGTNKYASQKGMTSFGAPRDVIDRIKSDNLAEITDEAKIAAIKGSTWLQSGTNKFASQKGQTGFGSPRDVMYKPKGTGGASEVPEEKARLTDGIVPLQSGTNKLASQAGMTGIGMPRIVDVRKTDDQDRESQGFIHLQMGTNRFANQSGMTGFGMPRREITKYKDEVRGEMPHDESTTSRQTSGWKEGASQAGMTGFGAFRNNTVFLLQSQDQRSQGLIPYQMGVNFLDSQAGKTAFGMPRRTYTAYIDDSHEDLPADIARQPDVPFWSGMETEFANQTGMTAFGTARDVRGEYVRRLCPFTAFTSQDTLMGNKLHRGVRAMTRKKANQASTSPPVTDEADVSKTSSNGLDPAVGWSAEKRTRDYCRRARDYLAAGRSEMAYVYANEVLKLLQGEKGCCRRREAAIALRIARYRLFPQKRMTNKALQLYTEARRCDRKGRWFEALQLIDKAQRWLSTVGSLLLRGKILASIGRHDLDYVNISEAMELGMGKNRVGEFRALQLESLSRLSYDTKWMADNTKRFLKDGGSKSEVTPRTPPS